MRADKKKILTKSYCTDSLIEVANFCKKSCIRGVWQQYTADEEDRYVVACFALIGRNIL